MTSCASPPTAELRLAEARVERARGAEASIYAPDLMSRVESTIDEAARLSEAESYREAIVKAGQAVALADNAVEQAQLQRRVTARHVSRCLRELEGLLAIVSSREPARVPGPAFAAFLDRYRGIEARAQSGDLLGALDDGAQLKPELLAFEIALR